MKCSGARDTRQGVTPCGRLAIPAKFDAFCCKEHQEDARLYVGDVAYNKHIEHFRTIAQNRNRRAVKSFNEGERVMFVSMIEAQQLKFQQEYKNTIGAEYAQGVLNAWSGVANSSDASSSYAQSLQIVTEMKQIVKRKSYDNLSDVLFRRPSTGLLLTDGRTSSCSSKKSRADSHVSDTDLRGYIVDEPEEVTSPTTPAPALDPLPAPVEPVNVPLPDDSDTDLMSE